MSLDLFCQKWAIHPNFHIMESLLDASNYLLRNPPPPRFSFLLTSIVRASRQLKNMEMQGNLKLQPSGRSSRLKVSSLPSPLFQFFQSFFCNKKDSTNNVIIFFFLLLFQRRRWQHYCRLLLSLFCCKENDGNNVVIFFWPCLATKKTMVAMLRLLLLFVWKEEDNHNVVVLFCPCFVVKKIMAIVL